ncbi:MAG: S8 family serine peptidase, partial [Acidobacteria bacterium]|nr:S8 family serine peptidase [Acidobacteriota bacterium]
MRQLVGWVPAAPSFRATVRRAAGLAVLASLVGLPATAGRRFPASPDDVVVPQEHLFKLRPGRDASTVLRRVSPLLAALTSVSRLNGGRDVYRLVLPAALGELLLDLLAADSDVDFLEPNRIRELAVAAPNDTKYATQWALTNIHAYDAWRVMPNQYPAGGDGTGRIKVAVLDSGSDCTHPDFQNAGGTSTYSPAGGQFSLLSEALVPTTRSSPACTWQDDHGHGTHTSGTVAAATNNGLGVSSLGYGVQLIIYKVT